MPDDQMNPVIGIDLGTTYSCLCKWNGRGPQLIPNQIAGRNTTPSVVYYDDRRGWVVGELAIRHGTNHPENAVFGVKRKMDDPAYRVSLGGKEYSPIDISGKILQAITEQYRNQFPADGAFKIAGMVVTVPYYFTTMQRGNTDEAAQLTGIPVLGILEEPTAAALGFAMEHPFTSEPQKVLVFDLGGGTFDITLFQVTDMEDRLLFEVLGSGGDSRLGGVDFDECVMQHCGEQMKSECGTNPLEVESETERNKARALIREAAIRAKEELSTMPETMIQVPNWLPGQHLEMDFTRETFDSLIKPFIQKLESITENTVQSAGLRMRDFDQVLAVGGSTKAVCIKELIKETTGKDPYQTDPDQHVAKGAAIYAAILDGRMEDAKPVEVVNRTSHALGVDANGKFQILIPANRPAPTRAKQVFTTSEDNCTELDVDVYEGHAPTVDKNTKIGTVNVRGLKPEPKGKLDIYITFEVSKDREISITIDEEMSGIHINEVLTLAKD